MLLFTIVFDAGTEEKMTKYYFEMTSSIYEINLKDIATVQNTPDNLFKWCETVKGVIDEVY